MKINPLTTKPSDLILLINGDKYIHYFYTGFWFWKKKELFYGCFNVMGVWHKYKVVDNKKKTTTYYTSGYHAFCNFLDRPIESNRNL